MTISAKFAYPVGRANHSQGQGAYVVAKTNPEPTPGDEQGESIDRWWMRTDKTVYAQLQRARLRLQAPPAVRVHGAIVMVTQVLLVATLDFLDMDERTRAEIVQRWLKKINARPEGGGTVRTNLNVPVSLKRRLDEANVALKERGEHRCFGRPMSLSVLVNVVAMDFLAKPHAEQRERVLARVPQLEAMPYGSVNRHVSRRRKGHDGPAATREIDLTPDAAPGGATKRRRKG